MDREGQVISQINKALSMCSDRSPRWRAVVIELESILTFLNHPEPKPCPEQQKDLPACGLCEYWHEFHPQRSTNPKCLACYEFCNGTGKQPAEQPEMKRISDEEIIKHHRFSLGAWSWTNSIREQEYSACDAQLAADKSHCAECKAGQEAEIGIIRKDRDSWLKSYQEKFRIFESEIASLKSQVKALKAALESDATDLWKVTNAIKKEIGSREWILEGRGCYAWDDEKYKDETRLAFEAVLMLIKNVQHPAQLRFDAVLKSQLAEKGK